MDPITFPIGYNGFGLGFNFDRGTCCLGVTNHRCLLQILFIPRLTVLKKNQPRAVSRGLKIICNKYSPCPLPAVAVSVSLRHRIPAGLWWVKSDLVMMVRERGLETFEFLCGYSVFVQVVPINSCLYKEWVFILIGSTRWDHYTFTVVSYQGSHYIVSYTIVKFFCSDLTFWFLVFNKYIQGSTLTFWPTCPFGQVPIYFTCPKL
jgi:hypothetical protein